MLKPERSSTKNGRTIIATAPRQSMHGKVYLTSRDGVITVVKAGRKFEILAQNEIEEEIASSLAISNGTLYIRSFEALYAIRN